MKTWTEGYLAPDLAKIMRYHTLDDIMTMSKVIISVELYIEDMLTAVYQQDQGS